MVATLPDIGGYAEVGDEGGVGRVGGGGAPLFLTRAEHAGLMRFVDERRSDTPQMLMLTGTIKSGKTRVLETVLPGLLAARLAADPRSRRPVVFLHSFLLSLPANESARNFADDLVPFAASIGLLLSPPTNEPTNALNRLPALLLQLAKFVHAEGGELWLLFDELQAPIVASTPAGALHFVYVIKRAVELCSPFARIVGTGSGMVSLLSAVRAAAPNGFALWDAISHVSLGREPPAPVALAMAKRILASYARSRCWPEDFAALLTPQRACDKLARDAHGELTSPRPALVAYLAGLVGDAKGGAPSAVLEEAVCALLLKVKAESLVDTATALIRMQPELRTWLRVLSAKDSSSKSRLRLQLKDNAFGNAIVKFASYLCEASEPARLLPPYAALLRSLVTRQGEVAVTLLSDGQLDYSPRLRRNLQLIAEHNGIPRHIRGSISSRAQMAISARVLATFSGNGIGVVKDGLPARAPQAVAEILEVPAFSSLLSALDESWLRLGKGGVCHSSAELMRAATASAGEQERFLDTLGMRALVWLRHVDSHVYSASSIAERSGLTAAVVGEAVQAAADALMQEDRAFKQDSDGRLRWQPASPRRT